MSIMLESVLVGGIVGLLFSLLSIAEALKEVAKAIRERPTEVVFKTHGSLTVTTEQPPRPTAAAAD